MYKVAGQIPKEKNKKGAVNITKTYAPSPQSQKANRGFKKQQNTSTPNLQNMKASVPGMLMNSFTAL